MPVHVGQMASEVVEVEGSDDSTRAAVEPPRQRWAFDRALQSSLERRRRLEAVDRDD